jgi:hypothetical protein
MSLSVVPSASSVVLPSSIFGRPAPRFRPAAPPLAAGGEGGEWLGRNASRPPPCHGSISDCRSVDDSAANLDASRTAPVIRGRPDRSIRPDCGAPNFPLVERPPNGPDCSNPYDTAVRIGGCRPKGSWSCDGSAIYRSSHGVWMFTDKRTISATGSADRPASRRRANHLECRSRITRP